MSHTIELRRSIALTPLIFYGLGTMVGGGFYALALGATPHRWQHTWGIPESLATPLWIGGSIGLVAVLWMAAWRLVRASALRTGRPGCRNPR